jgi:GNAT superfamily N-acetyltransferase
LIATFDGRRGKMYRLAVHPRFQRHGIAGRLAQEAHRWLEGLGCRRITALVESEYDGATSFWESCGYEHDASMRRYHLDIGKPE